MNYTICNGVCAPIVRFITKICTTTTLRIALLHSTNQEGPKRLKILYLFYFIVFTAAMPPVRQVFTQLGKLSK
jgi:hypothetical protein